MTSLPAPAAEVDISAFVVHRLDRHLRDLQHLRERMRTNSTTGPGDRLALTCGAVRLAEQFADELKRALGPDGLP